MATTWKFGEKKAANLVCMDVIGFTSHERHPDHYLILRTLLFRAVEATHLYQRASRAKVLHTQFLGDELRLAIRDDVATADDIVSFLEEVFHTLKGSIVAVRAVVAYGPVTPTLWRNCVLLTGTIASKVQRWLSDPDLRDVLKEQGTVVADAAFFMSVSASARWRPYWSSSEESLRILFPGGHSGV